MKLLHVCICLSLATVYACKSSKRTHRTAMSASASASSAPPTFAASATAESHGAIPKLPALTPPPDALTGPKGVRWKLLARGSGRHPEEGDAISADVTVWRADGTLAISSHNFRDPSVFQLDRIGPEFRSIFAQLTAGSSACYWMPSAALEGWRPADWPSTGDLIVVVELISANAQKRKTLGMAADTPAPDAAGPPANATPFGKQGVRYVVQTSGSAQAPHPSATSRIVLELNGWETTGLVVKPVLAQYRTTTTPARAPAGLGGLIQNMAQGDRIRVWLPASLAGEVVPEAKGELVLDVTLAQIQ